MILLITILFLALPTFVSGGELSGNHRVVDGDTIAFGKVYVRLEGIDAPEKRQRCSRQYGEKYPCGRKSTQHLVNLIGDSQVHCKVSGKGRWGRYVGTCYTQDKKNLNRLMVLDGWAVAYRKYSKLYIDEEEIAREKRYGMWQGEFIPPWEFRALNRKKK